MDSFLMNADRANSKLINVGLVGVGDHMEENLLPALKSIPNVRFKAVASSCPEKSVRLKTAWDISESYKNISEMLQEKSVEVIICSGSPDFHQSAIKEAIDRKVPIFVEKPSCLEPKFLSQFQNKALDNQIFIFTGYNFIYSDSFIRYQHLVADKSGLIEKMHFHANKPKSTMWGLSSTFESFIFAVGIHALSIVYVRFNHCEFQVKIIKFEEKDGLFYAIIDCFISNQSIILELSNANPFLDWRIEFISNNQEMIVSNNFNSITKLKSASETPYKNEKTIYQYPELKGGYTRTGYRNQFLHMIDTLNQWDIDRVRMIHSRDYNILQKCVEIVKQQKEAKHETK